MGFFPRKHAGSYGGNYSSGDSSFFQRFFRPSVTSAGVHVTQATAIALPVVYCAIGIISDSLSLLPIDILQRTKSGKKTPVRDHPLHSILNLTQNPYMSAITSRQSLMYHTLGWGNGYQEIERTNGGEVHALWPLLPDTTEPVKIANEDKFFYRTTIAGRSFDLKKDDVLHIPALGYDGYRGYSPISICRQAIGLAIAMEEFGAKFFKNDAKSGGFLLHPGKLGPEGSKNVAESFEKKAGLDHAHRVKVLEEGMKYVQTTIAPEDAQFLGSRQFQIEEIARIYRVPLPLLQSMQKSTSWGTGLEQQTLGFLTWTINPWVVKIEQEMNIKLLSEDERAKGLFIKMNMNALMRGDMNARSTYYKNGIVDGWLTRNEAREKEDLDPLPGLDEPLVPLNMAGDNDPRGGKPSPSKPPAAPDEEDDPDAEEV